MNNSGSPRPGAKKLGAINRNAVTVSQGELVRLSSLQADRSLPMLIEPNLEELDLIRWAASNRELIEKHLLEHGGILFRNFGVRTPEYFEQFIAAACEPAMEYKERSSPRSQVSGNIYTSTDYPADHSIFLHNEHSYSHVVPLKILFFCLIPAEQRGETPIADCRKIFRRIDPMIRERFARLGWMYVRNFGDGYGLPWQTVFQTDDQAAVERYCLQAGIEVQWKVGNRLRTRQVRPAIAKHPKTGEEIWFNHLTFFHVSTLEPAIRDALQAEFKEEDLPNNTYYGDGSQIEPSVLDELRDAYLQEKVMFPWQQGDVLLLDNMLTAHGREPFVGPRKTLVGMAEAYRRTDI